MCKTDRCQFSNHPVQNLTTTNTKAKITCKIFKGFWKEKKKEKKEKYWLSISYTPNVLCCEQGGKKTLALKS